MTTEKEYKELLAFAKTVVSKSTIIEPHDLVHEAYMIFVGDPSVDIKKQIRNIFFNLRRQRDYAIISLSEYQYIKKVDAKVCTKCKRPKAIDFFRLRKRNDRPTKFYSSWCIKCEKINSNDRSKSYYEKMKGKKKFKKRRKAICKKWRKKWLKKVRGTPEYEKWQKERSTYERDRQFRKRNAKNN